MGAPRVRGTPTDRGGGVANMDVTRAMRCVFKRRNLEMNCDLVAARELDERGMKPRADFRKIRAEGVLESAWHLSI